LENNIGFDILGIMAEVPIVHPDPPTRRFLLLWLETPIDACVRGCME